jgi:predicted alpha/beta hydrolase family esterase
MESIKAIIIPGNGDDNPTLAWKPFVTKALEGLGIKTINVKFPDAVLARAEYWLPFIKELGADENTILIGHSSGAVAAMRYAEHNTILGSVLVGVCYTDLGDENEKQSGYYDKKWKWESIRRNQKWIIEFASKDDPFIPIKEPRFIQDMLGTEYFEYNNRGHFIDRIDFPELIEAIKNKLKM